MHCPNLAAALVRNAAFRRQQWRAIIAILAAMPPRARTIQAEGEADRLPVLSGTLPMNLDGSGMAPLPLEGGEGNGDGHPRQFLGLPQSKCTAQAG